MALTAAQLEQQKKQAEELLFSGPETLGFCKGLFFGHFNAKLIFPYPTLDEKTQSTAKLKFLNLSSMVSPNSASSAWQRRPNSVVKASRNRDIAKSWKSLAGIARRLQCSSTRTIASACGRYCFMARNNKKIVGCPI
jgi:hypothetical protein